LQLGLAIDFSCWIGGTRANVDSYMRNLLDFLVGHFFLVRGEQRRGSVARSSGGVDPHATPASSSRPWIERPSGHCGRRILEGKGSRAGALRSQIDDGDTQTSTPQLKLNLVTPIQHHFSKRAIVMLDCQVGQTPCLISGQTLLIV
jgi:hypothetical protein